MALIHCTKCGHLVSTTAPKCPSCGTPPYSGRVAKSGSVNVPPAGPPTTKDPDIGEVCLLAIASTWGMDEDWSAAKWVDNGFDWSPGSHLVRVRAFPNGKSGTNERWRVSVETNVLAGVPIEDTKFIETVASDDFASTYSTRYPPAEIWKAHPEGQKPKLSFFSSVYVDADLVSWLPHFLAQEALLQLNDADASSVTMSKLLGGEPDFLPSGKNEDPDPIFEVVANINLKGYEPSRWSDTDEFVNFEKQFGRSNSCFGIGDRSGLTLETPFGSSSALVRLWSDQQHPQLGNGLLVTIQSPFSAAKEKVSKEAALLNFWESHAWTDFSQLGSWHAREFSNGQSHLTD